MSLYNLRNFSNDTEEINDLLGMFAVEVDSQQITSGQELSKCMFSLKNMNDNCENCRSWRASWEF